MEVEVEIPDYLKHFEDDSKGRSSKVSKIATMFQCPSENDERDERDGPGLATVVRTESHVARFNTARALFEKMAEKKDDAKAAKAHNQKRQFIPLQSSRSLTSACGKAHSRSPSPPVVSHSTLQSNGHHCSCKSNPSSVSTIASISCTSAAPSFHSSSQNPSIPSILPFKPRSSSFDSEALKGKWHNTIPGTEASKSNYNEHLRNKIELTKHQIDERLAKSQEVNCSTNRTFHTLPSKIDGGNREFIARKHEQSSVKPVEIKPKPNLLSKPDKPAKPETLIDKPLSSHLQNQQIIQRHKNWFQAFSKTKSPATSPQKQQQTATCQPGCNTPEQRRHSEDPADIHNDWRRERSTILTGSGRIGNQEAEEHAGRGPADISNAKNFENAPTLPSCWSPPQQYNESSSLKSDKSSSIYQDTPRPSSSSSSNDDGKRYSSKGERVVEGKTFIITDISKDSRVSNIEKKNAAASQIDKNVAGVFRKESDYEKKNLVSLPQEVERRNKDLHPEEENIAKSNVVYRHQNDHERDKEMRLKDWEKRLSQREGGFYGVHDVTGDRHSNRDSRPNPNYDRKDPIKSYRDSRECYHEDYLHKTYKAIEKDSRHTERFEKEAEAKSFSEDDRERRKSLQIEREKVREERRVQEDKIIYTEEQLRLRGKDGKDECKEVYERRSEKHVQSSRKEHNENLDGSLLKRNLVSTVIQPPEKFDQRERSKTEEEKRERLRKEEKELREKLMKEEERERIRKEEDERKKLRSKKEEELERLRKQKRREEEEPEKVRRPKEERERTRRESGEKDRSVLERGKTEDNVDRLRREEKDREKLRKEKEEWEKLKREMEEKERIKREGREQEKLRKEEDREKQVKEMRELEKWKREEEEKAKLKRKEKERLRREEEEQERMKREEEEKKRLMREIEMERFRKAEEDRERLRKEEEEKERLRKEEEAKERLRKEKEERMRKEEEERLRKEEEERLRKEEEERLRKEEEERLRREQEEHEEKLRKAEEFRRKEEERLWREEEEKRRKEIERRRREEEERLRKMEEEKLRREEERLRKEEEEVRLRKEEEERLKREQEERLRREEEERLRREEEERLKREEEEERLRKQEEERVKRQEEERKKQEEERLKIREEERLRKQEEEWLRKQEEQRLRKQEEERLRRQDQERLRKQEQEKLKRQEEERLRKEEVEKLLRREHEERLKKAEEERSKRREEEIQRRKVEEQEKNRKEEELLQKQKLEKENRDKEEKENTSLKEEEKDDVNKIESAEEYDLSSLDSSNIEENRLGISQKDLLERKWQAKREKLEEEERVRREKDRLEIEKTKKRIAELKKERDEIQRQQAVRLRKLMKQENGEDPDDDEPSDNSMSDESENSSQNIIIIATSESENVVKENEETIYSNASKNENEALQVNTFGQVKSTSSTMPDENGSEEITYDHTVQSAQHKLEFCTGSYNESISKDVQNSSTPNLERFTSSTLSSEFEPLPPPVPPHSIDPAILSAEDIIEQTPLPPIPPPHSLDVCSEMPELMTPEEADKLLSHNIIETKKSLISEALEADSSRDLNTSEVSEMSVVKSDVGEESIIRSKEEEDGLDKDYDSVCVDSPTPDNEENLDDSFSSFKHEVNEEGFVVRAKEVLSEDGVHYLEDGHFWIQVPGLLEEDEDDIPDTVPFHKHTKLKFSQDPIKLFSTFSVNDYDRRNDDVDPVAASAEYELEKRVEKMNVFPVSIDKGDGGLGLSIIGMGVGADAGVEKLGIFVKTITPGGATDRDGRIRVNDQIIEVDNQSLVGVTQMFAASVLKNTSGTVNFFIGRESDPENSEVAMLIRQSLMADQERDERRRALGGPNYDSREGEGAAYESFSSQSGGDSPSEDGPRGSNFVRELHREPSIYGQEYVDQFGDVYNSCQASSPRGTSSPPPEAFNHDVEGRDLLLQNNEIMIMSQHLQEIQHRNEMYEEEINILRNKISELETELGNVSEISKKLQEANATLDVAEDTIKSKQAEICTYQDMLQQSQGQYIILEKKYYKAKKIIKEYQSRERDFLHREEYHITQLEEKDALYNSLVKALKDRVIQLEGDLIKAQQEAGLPIKVPPDLNTQSSNFVYSSKAPDNHSSLQRDPPRKPATIINCLDPDLSDTEGGDTHTSEGSKSSTVERKIPSKEELDVAVPPTELLDNSFSKAKGELASRGGLANRQLPSLKKSASNASNNSFDNSLDDGLDNAAIESHQQPQVASPSIISVKSSVSSISQNESIVNTSHSSASMTSFTINSQSPLQENISSNSRSHPPPPYHSVNSQTSIHPPSPHHQPPPYQPPPSAPLSHRPVVASDSHSGRSDGSYRHPPPVARVQPVNRVEALPSPTSPSSQQQHQQTLANQLKAILAEREGNNEASQDTNRDGSPVKKSPSSLMEDVRRAVMQADISIGKKPVISGPIHVSSTAQVVSTGQFVHSRTSPQKGLGAALPQKVSRDSGTWSPAVINTSSPAGGVVLLSQRPIDSSLPYSPSNEMGGGLENRSGMASSDSNTSFDSQHQLDRVLGGRSPRETSVMSVFDWSKEQVAQWLVTQGLENYVSTFVNAGITGPRLINIDTKDLKNLGLSSDDKNKIKRKVKDLRQNLEKERKQIEKENKEREKLQKKAEKLAEKAERRKK